MIESASLPQRTRRRTHCKRGHIFDEANTIVTHLGERRCRTCVNRNQRKLRGFDPDSIHWPIQLETKETVEINGDAARIPLRASDGSIRAYVTVDLVDLDEILQHRWHLNSRGYASGNKTFDGKRRTILLHRELLGLMHGDGMDGDHVDRDRLNNRRSNLRVVPGMSANRQNVPSQKGTSQYRGVHWDRHNGKWKAQICVNRQQIALGYFDTEDEAAAAAKSARRRLMPYSTD